MKYYPASTRTVFVDPSFPGLSVCDRDPFFPFRPSMKDLFQQPFTIETPFTTTELFNMHVCRAQS